MLVCATRICSSMASVIKFDSEKTNAEAIIKVIEDTGYKAEVMKDEKTKDHP